MLKIYLLITGFIILSTIVGCTSLVVSNCKAVGNNEYICDMTRNPYCPMRFDCEK